MSRLPETLAAHPLADRRALLLTIAAAALLACVPRVSAAPVALNALGTAYTENFDTLANAGTSSVVPLGWTFLETGTNAETTYAAGTGSNNAGNTYSFGSTGSSERAFGGLLSGSLNPTIGASFMNNTGATILSLAIAYTGEQWRAGVTSRGAADRLDFQISFDATALNNGTWTDVDALDFASPNISTNLGLLDGNAAGNRSLVAASINLSLADGATFWIRWSDFNITNSDDGLAVDDYSLTPFGRVPVPAPEPGMLALLGLGALAGLARRRRPTRWQYRR